jgi:hypothetical protein
MGVISAPSPDIWVNVYQVYLPVFGGRRTISWVNYTAVLAISNSNQTGTTPGSSNQELSTQTLANAMGNYPGILANMPLASTSTQVDLTQAGSVNIAGLTSATVRVTTCPNYCIMRPGDPRLIAVGWISFMDSQGVTSRRYVNFDTTNFRAPLNASVTGLSWYFRAGVVASIDLESITGMTLAVIGNYTVFSA